MMFLVGLMSMMAVGATAFYGYDSNPAGDEEADETAAQDFSDEEATDGLSDLLEEPEDVFPGGVTESRGVESVELDGTEQADFIEGSDSGDTIAGLEGNDLLYGDEGDDDMAGGAGADSLHGEAGADTLSGGAGEDDVMGYTGNDLLSGDAGDDSLVGGSGEDTVAGGAGDDALHGGLDDDRLTGGEGQDTLFGGWGDDIVDGADDDDQDFLNGGGGDDLLIAGSDDIVTAGEGADTVALGDWIMQDHQAEILDFEAAEDQLMIVYNDLSGEEPDVTVEQDAESADQQNIVLNGEIIAAVHGAATLAVEDIVLVGQSAFGSQTSL